MVVFILPKIPSYFTLESADLACQKKLFADAELFKQEYVFANAEGYAFLLGYIFHNEKANLKLYLDSTRETRCQIISF